MDLIFGIACITLLLGTIVVLKKGFNEVIKGMESIDERLKKLENKSED
ncbi:hypothetical protein [Roseivirga sp. 4D4]|nr:hypothetical protein [Roseivirga sp. 4D4]